MKLLIEVIVFVALLWTFCEVAEPAIGYKPQQKLYQQISMLNENHAQSPNDKSIASALLAKSEDKSQLKISPKHIRDYPQNKLSVKLKQLHDWTLDFIAKYAKSLFT